MKKFLSMTMTLIMLMALAVPAFAVNKESDSNCRKRFWRARANLHI